MTIPPSFAVSPGTVTKLKLPVLTLSSKSAREPLLGREGLSFRFQSSNLSFSRLLDGLTHFLFGDPDSSSDEQKLNASSSQLLCLQGESDEHREQQSVALGAKLASQEPENKSTLRAWGFLSSLGKSRYLVHVQCPITSLLALKPPA